MTASDFVKNQSGSYRLLIRPLIAGLLAALSAWIFIRTSEEMLEGDTGAFDMTVLRIAQALRSRHPWVAEVMQDLSGLGSVTVLTLFSVIAVAYLGIVRSRLAALLVAAAILTGSLGVDLLKNGFGRSRPDVAFAQLVAPGLSFPSGHAAMSAIVFLTIGALLAGTRSRTLEQMYILGVASLMAVLVGISRVVLGVHWATDVLAGWAIGTAWALIWLLALRRLAQTSRTASPATRAPTDEDGSRPSN